MRNIFSILLVILVTAACQHKPSATDASGLQQAIDMSILKLEGSITSFNNSELNPRSITDDGETHFVESRDWTSGFYPGCLWYIYELSKDENFKLAAEAYTKNIYEERLNETTHDMGFKVYCSYGNGFRITGNQDYRETLVKSAETLITRYNPIVGCIRSWDHHAHVWDYPVIIDNMLNLELLMWAFKETSDSTYYKISVSHADKTIENHFREDFSTFHVVDYDTISGEVIKKNTHQGYSHESAWARGQAWGLYGYTMMYRETKLERYLVQAEKIADFILSHPNLPEDFVPYWDFNAPEIPDEPRDVSAAAIISSALLELSTFSKVNKERYLHSADVILESLCSENYLADKNASHYFLLEHSTGNWPNESEIDVPIIYADYYFLEAIKRKKKLEKGLF